MLFLRNFIKLPSRCRGYFFLIFLMQLCLSAMSQSWCTPGSQWFFKHWNMWTGEGYVQNTYVKDTVMDGKSWNQINSKTVSYSIITGVSESEGKMYTLTSNQLVLIHGFLKGTPFLQDTLFNFSAKIGDSWRMHPTDKATCAASRVLVEDTGSRVIQGIRLKWLALKYSSSNWIKNDTAYERLGSLLWYSYHAPNVCKLYTDSDWGGPLRCFSDHQITEYKGTYDGACDYFINDLTSGATSAEKIIVYPNPFVNTVEIISEVSGAVELNYQIFTVDGRVVLSGAIEGSARVNFSDHPAGLYFIKFYIDGYHVRSTKVIKQ
jgi:hypothetical protein